MANTKKVTFQISVEVSWHIDPSEEEPSAENVRGRLDLLGQVLATSYLCAPDEWTTLRVERV